MNQTINNNYDYVTYLLENLKVEGLPSVVKVPKEVLLAGKETVDSYIRVMLVDCYEITYDKKQLTCNGQLDLNYKELTFDYNDYNGNYADDSYIDCNLDVILPNQFIASYNYDCISYIGMFSTNRQSVEEIEVEKERIVQQELYERIASYLPMTIIVNPVVVE